MSDASMLAPVAGAVLLGVISPGPNFVLVTSVAARSRAEARAVALGFSLAALVWSSASIGGLALLLFQVGWLYRGVQIAGGAYLVYVGLRTMLKRAVRPGATALSRTGLLRSVRRGFVANVGNPKSAAFYGSVFATLVPHHVPPHLCVYVVLTCGAISLAWYWALAWAFSTPRVQKVYTLASRVVDRVSGCLLSGSGMAMIARA